MKLQRTCQQCGASFYAWPSEVKRGRKFCSHECHVASRHVLDTDRFWSQVDKSGECWIWTGGCSGAGYGRFCYGGRAVETHRLSYKLCVGPIPEGMMVCHHCDNRQCVRPDHLFLGSALDNNHDMRNKGRDNTPVGAARSHTKLTAEDVLEIRAQRKAGVKVRVLAERFGITTTHVSVVATGRSWKHLAPETFVEPDPGRWKRRRAASVSEAPPA